MTHQMGEGAILKPSILTVVGRAVLLMVGSKQVNERGGRVFPTKATRPLGQSGVTAARQLGFAVTPTPAVHDSKTQPRQLQNAMEFALTLKRFAI